MFSLQGVPQLLRADNLFDRQLPTIAIVDLLPLLGKSILYTVTGNNVTNVWSQPLDGDPPKEVTEFREMLMTGFAWSRDGKQLACTRGNLVRDAVLIRDLK